MLKSSLNYKTWQWAVIKQRVQLGDGSKTRYSCPWLLGTTSICIRVCHPNAESYKQLEPKQIYRLHENEKKCSYTRRVLDIEYGSFTPLCLPLQVERAQNV